MASDTAGHDWPFTEEEMAAIKEYHSGRAKITSFKTADEAVRWLNRQAPPPGPERAGTTG